MKNVHRMRRFIVSAAALAGLAVVIFNSQDMWQPVDQPVAAPAAQQVVTVGQAADELEKIPVKGRAPKTGYERSEFGNGWANIGGCDTRNIILNRDLTNVTIDQNCKVLTGTLNDPYTATTVAFQRGAATSDKVQIDHVVALSDAWQKGAQQLTKQERTALANDPLELLAVDGAANQQKSDGDAATWLPDNKSFRCQYVARQIAVKVKYRLWVTQAEGDVMRQVLGTCPGQMLPLE